MACLLIHNVNEASSKRSCKKCMSRNPVRSEGNISFCRRRISIFKVNSGYSLPGNTRKWLTLSIFSYLCYTEVGVLRLDKESRVCNKFVKHIHQAVTKIANQTYLHRIKNKIHFCMRETRLNKCPSLRTYMRFIQTMFIRKWGRNWCFVLFIKAQKVGFKI